VIVPRPKWLWEDKTKRGKGVRSQRPVAQTLKPPFDRLRANGVDTKYLDFFRTAEYSAKGKGKAAKEHG